ncbi:MAG: phosphopentomutase [Anaerolineae bacterium]|nr:phosphopentomutase [Anaerolineae bacterium]
MFDRFFVIVLDGVGVGEAPDAADYGDAGSNSLGNTAAQVGGLNVPNLQRLGLGNLSSIEGVTPKTDTVGAYGRCREQSKGKGSVVGHWELMGVITEKTMPTYPNGFPESILRPFSKATGRGILGNKAASGTEIIKELGEQHLETGDLIVYTSADSVFQIAANEQIIPIEEQYEICQIARNLLTGDHAVGRVIARPFIGETKETFRRTSNRRDYPLVAPAHTLLDLLVAAGYSVYATGKIDDLFGHRGITHSHHTVDNNESIQAGIRFLDEDFSGLLISNLIEFDMIYGHRNDVRGYANLIEKFDAYIPTIQQHLKLGDAVMIVADHGVDPTTPSTDHSREYIPLLVFGPKVKRAVRLGDRNSFSDVAATIAENFALSHPVPGTSFLMDITNQEYFV